MPRLVAANLPGAIRGIRAGRKIVASWRKEGRTLPPSAGDAQYPAPYARRLSPRRSLAIRSFGLPRVRAVAKALDATINDVFLTAASGAVRRLALEQDGVAPAGPMVATVPFALVPLAERTRDGNFSTVCHTLLFADVADPLERLAACQRAANTMKQYFEATREANVAALFNLLPPMVPKAIDRINEMKEGGLLPFWNIVASNVPGPRTPLQLGKMKLAQWFSIGQIAHGAALNVTVWSYVDQFNISVLSDAATLDDPHELTDAMIDAFVEIRSAAGLSDELTAVETAMPRSPWWLSQARRATSRTPRTGTGGPRGRFGAPAGIRRCRTRAVPRAARRRRPEHPTPPAVWRRSSALRRPG